MSRARRILRAILVAGTLGQIPAVLLVARMGGWPLALAVAAIISAPFFFRLSRGSITEGDERGPLAWAQLVFFAWWGASLLITFLWPAATVIARLGHGSLGTADAIALGLSALGGVAGVSWNRVFARLHSVDVVIADLPEELEGYRIAHLSDLHIGGHTPRERVRSWVDRINLLTVDLVAVTGDLITMGNQHLGSIAEELGRLRSTDGAFVCLGNHDYFADTEQLVRNLRAAGLHVLRNEGRVIESRGARYFLAGVDDTWTGRADPDRTLAGRPEGLAAIVLAHDPNLFDDCARLGADLVLSGHTHGGQLAFPLAARTINAARIAYRYTTGLYKSGTSTLFVTRGAGTTGPPLRIGSPSEIALITLRSA